MCNDVPTSVEFFNVFVSNLIIIISPINQILNKYPSESWPNQRHIDEVIKIRNILVIYLKKILIDAIYKFKGR